jgi:omega-amidase
MADLKLSLIQADLKWESKEENLSAFEEKIKRIDRGTHVVILPEMFTTGFSMRPETLVTWMKRIAAEHKTIVTGSLIIEEDGNYFNRMIWMLPNGSYGYYNKRHLFAYAKEHEHYTPGTKRFIASVNGWRINLMVCYDLRFPVWARQHPKEGEDFEYDILVYVANWPENRVSAWKTLLQARAIENQSYVIGVNRVGIDGNNNFYTGDSSVFDPMGELMYQKSNEEDVFSFTLERSRLDEVRRQFQFWKDRDDFVIVT